MSLKKDPSLRLAANGPHLVSLGGGRLSCAVTIHQIPIGDCTIGTSTDCLISLSGGGIKPVHCTLYRSEENEVTLVPERNARIQIDGELINEECNLRQGSMITIGDTYYLRYNNPAEAKQMQQMMSSQEDKFNATTKLLESFYDSTINPLRYEEIKASEDVQFTSLNNIKSLDIDGWQCPKVFTADLAVVNMPAKDVLGHKYVNFAKNLAENHRRDKNINEKQNDDLYANIPTVKQTKKNNNNDVSQNFNVSRSIHNNLKDEQSGLSTSFDDHLEDMLKICSEYTDRQDRSCNNTTSSPINIIKTNRIKTNGSLPRDKKSPFNQELQQSFADSTVFTSNSPIKKSSGYENVRTQVDNICSSPKKSSGYENVIIVPQSPRTKIRTICVSPKKESSLFLETSTPKENVTSTNYDNLIKNFEEKFQQEIKKIEESSKYHKSASNTARRTSTNINNLSINLNATNLSCNSPTPNKKPAPAPRNINRLRNLKKPESREEIELTSEHEDLLERIQHLKTEISIMQEQENESLREIEMENTFVSAELKSLLHTKQKLQKDLLTLQQKVHSLEAQRNSTRVMEENQQAKLKQSIDMKQDQVEKLKELLKQKPDNACLKEELANVKESLENDKKSFEDLEFQYFEGESEWHSYREELKNDETLLLNKIQENMESLEKVEKINSTIEHGTLSKRLLGLLNDLETCERHFNILETKLSSNIKGSIGMLTQSLFGSEERLCTKSHNDDMMSKSVNENMFFSCKKIELQKTNNLLHISASKDEIKQSRNSISSPQEATEKIFDSIREIERNRQLLLNQQAPGQFRTSFLLSSIEDKKDVTQMKDKDNLHSSSSRSNQNCITPNILSRPLSPSSTEAGDDFSSPMRLLSRNEIPSVNSESPNSLKAEEKRSSSGLSNDCSFSESSVRKKSPVAKCQRPLTRYLPIFAQDLNLKQHIESAGHQITLCPQVFIDARSCRGYLQKLGSTFHTWSWSKRWFVLDRTRSAFIYYSDKTERKPRGGAYFSSIDEVYMDHLNASKNNRPHCTFIVKTKKRSYFLQAASDRAARIWIDAIITGAQGNLDY